MGETGPCGPCSEIFCDQGTRVRRAGRSRVRRRGALRRDLEPRVHAVRPAAERRAWSPLPKPSIDTGAGLERNLVVLQGVDSVFDTDVMVPPARRGAAVDRDAQRAGDERPTSSLRILAEHARTMTLPRQRRRLPLQRGPRLRAAAHHPPRGPPRLPAGRREARHAGAGRRAIDVMAEAYPELERNRDFVTGVIVREEEPLPPDAAHGLGDPRRGARPAPRAENASRRRRVPGCTTPTASRSRSPPRSRRSGASRSTRPGSTSRWTSSAGAARTRARSAGRPTRRRASTASCSTSSGRPSSPATETASRRAESSPCSPRASTATSRSSSTARRSTPSRAARSATPERSRTDTGRAEVTDTTYALPGLRRHVARVVEGEINPGQEARRGDRRRAARRHPPQPHGHAPPALGAARGAR